MEVVEGSRIVVVVAGRLGDCREELLMLYPNPSNNSKRVGVSTLGASRAPYLLR